jgi:hypothetical protein
MRPDAVVVFHEQVFFLDLGARRVFRRRIKILDHLEYIGKRGQLEHQHHQAADAGRALEAVRAVLQVLQVIAVEQGLALFLQAEQGIDFALRFARSRLRKNCT